MKKIYYFIFTILVVALIAAALIIVTKSNKEDRVAEKKSKEVAEAVEEIKYSRLTFFNLMPIRASMNIPEDWEGKYRLRDQGAVARLYYIGEAPLEAGLMDLKIYGESDWDKKEKIVQRLRSQESMIRW